MLKLPLSPVRFAAEDKLMENTHGANDAQYLKMTGTPVNKLILSLSVPTVISMLVTALYNTADTFFVAKLGTSATGAVSIVFSLMALIQAVGFTVGSGAGSLVSRLLGQKQNDRANEIASSGIFAGLFFGTLITVLGLIFLDPIMLLLGSTDTILPYARDYARYILIAAPAMNASFVLNFILRSEGRAKFAMVGIAAGGILNIALDPLLIFTFNMGIAGAAIATGISQLVSFVILLSVFFRGKSITKLSVKHAFTYMKGYWEILKIGFPSFCRQGLASIASILLNREAAVYGDAVVAAYSIVLKLFMLVFSAFLGFGQGFQPVAGYNYGAKLYDRVRASYRFTLILGTVVMTGLGLLFYIFAPQLISLFISDDPAVLEVGVYALRIQCFTMPVVPSIVATNMLFQSTGFAGKSTFLSSARQGVFFVPLILVLPRFFGLDGILFTQPGADYLTAACSIPMAIAFFKKLQKAKSQ